MALQSDSQKKSYCVMEDIYGVVMAPKEELQQLQLQLRKKPAPPHLMLPDIGRAFEVLFSLFNLFGFIFQCSLCPFAFCLIKIPPSHLLALVFIV